MHARWCGLRTCGDFLEIIGKEITVLGLAAGKRIAVEQVRMTHVLGIGIERAELSLVQPDAAHTETAEVDAVVGLLPANQHAPLPFAAGLMIGQRDLQRGIDGLGAGIGEEDVIEARGHLRQPVGGLEGDGVTLVEAMGKIQRGGLLLDGFDDRLAVVADVAAPQPTGAVDQAVARHGRVVHAVGRSDDAGIILEPAARRERHPVGIEIVWHLIHETLPVKIIKG